IDFGNTGEAPPIFAQAAGAPIQYVAYEPPAPKGEAILVAKDSPLKSVADLKGKKVALNKGSNVHYLLVKALEKAGVKYSEIEPAVPVVEVALRRQAYGIKPSTDAVIADQQQVADAFFALNLIPKAIKISDVARRPGT